ncbi:hypothetical protein WG66_007002 [Moniliophthora roreri]|nr:hypothetical protein WG66_007002 [Moniliophthora roreri]
MNGRCRPVDPDSDAMRGYSTKDKANKDHCMSVDALRSLHYYPTCFARDMCYYLVDGRLWACGHFEPMSSSHQDCLKSTCLFSSAHPLGEELKPLTMKTIHNPPYRMPIHQLHENHAASCAEPDQGLQNQMYRLSVERRVATRWRKLIIASVFESYLRCFLCMILFLLHVGNLMNFLRYDDSDPELQCVAHVESETFTRGGFDRQRPVQKIKTSASIINSPHENPDTPDPFLGRALLRNLQS